MALKKVSVSENEAEMFEVYTYTFNRYIYIYISSKAGALNLGSVDSQGSARSANGSAGSPCEVF